MFFLILVGFIVLALWTSVGVRAYQSGIKGRVPNFYIHLVIAIAVSLLGIQFIPSFLDCRLGGISCAIEELIYIFFYTLIIMFVYPVILLFIWKQKRDIRLPHEILDERELF